MVSDLEHLLTQVRTPDVRPLAGEAWTCYSAGAVRASIAATWSAVTTDIIGKLIELAESDDGKAKRFSAKLIAAQSKGISTDGVRQMQQIETELLDTAVEFELIDSVGKRELERIREDRNLCVHPSLRPFGDVYEPRPEQARAHLVIALTTLLIHPPTQGRKAIDAYLDYTCDPKFAPESVSHIQAVFFDRLRSGTRKGIAKLAAKHALLELDPGERFPSAQMYADRSAVVLSAFAQRDPNLVRTVVAEQRDKVDNLDSAAQLRALGRLGTEDFFWDLVDVALTDRLTNLLSGPISPSVDPDVTAALAMVGNSQARRRLPVLERQFNEMNWRQKLRLADLRPAEFFVPTLIELLRDAPSFRDAEAIGQLVLVHARWLRQDTLRQALQFWAANDQCLKAAEMPQIATELFETTRHLGTDQQVAFLEFLSAAKQEAPDPEDYYQYPALTAAMTAAGVRAPDATETTSPPT